MKSLSGNILRKKFIVKLMNKITSDEIKRLTEQCLLHIQSDELYRVRNDAKLRAVNSCKSYDEFK